MWTCQVCQAEVDDDTWTTCWKCTSARDLSEAELAEVQARHRQRLERFQQCLRCDSRLEYAGTRRFHEGSRLGFWLGDWGELFVNREAFDVYCCPKCGKVEFYIDGIGDDLRGDD